MGAAPPPSASASASASAITADGADLVSALGAPSSWPPGFRFHPTDEELVLYYLKRKVCRRRIRLPMIGDVDVYKFEPWELPDRSVLRSGDKQWYFFSPRDRKYPNGSRSNRTTRCGYWKATGKDRIIVQHSRPAGYKKTLVYHQGRAPKGQRTDWVMYEYTMDEELMSNFDNVQDYYALYKVFRKSGPGPKNGEQYGAPFREDKWDDESDGDADCSLAVQEVRVEAVADGSGGLLCDGEDSRVESESVGVHSRELEFDDTGILTAGDLEELLMQMTSEEMPVPLQSQFPVCDPKVGVESELGSHTMGPSYAISSITKQTDGGWCEQDSIGTSLHIPQSAPMYAQLSDTTEVTYLDDCYELDHAVAEQEFMEIKDINCPPVWGTDDNKHEDDTNIFYDPCDYFDPSMILAETMGSLDATATFSYLEGFSEGESLNNGTYITSGFWTHEQPFNVSAPMQSNEVLMPSPTSGVVFSNNVSNPGGDTQGQIGGSGSESWFNSTVAALLASVPSPPAIASENSLITRAFERVASFKTGQITLQGQNSTAGGNAVVGRRQRGSNSSFIFISFLVGLGAIFWVLTIGVAVKIIKTMWSRFVTS